MASKSSKNRRRRDYGPLSAAGALCMQVLTVLVAVFAAGSFAWMAAQRLVYPYDIEWMEGSMLHHALRIASGQQIYAPPSIDFIPHLYTPLYPMVVAALGKLFGGVSYLIGRAVSLGSFVLSLGIAVYFAYREGRSLTASLAAMAIPIAAFADAGGFYDLARCDSLQLFLTTAGAALAFYGRDNEKKMAGAALLLVAAFFAKQTAAPFIVCIGLASLAMGWQKRPVWVGAATGAVAGVICLYAQNRASDGWFWTYIFRLHQSHSFFTRRAFVETPIKLLTLLGPAILLVPWAMLSQTGKRGTAEPDTGVRYLAWLGLGGFFTACLAFGTQWAHSNAFIPGLFFPALAIAAAAGRLLDRPSAPRAQTSSQKHGRAFRHGLVFLLLLSSLVPRVRGMHPAAHVPTAADRQAGDEVIARLRSAPGEVLIPFHPFYAHLAGKRVFLHRMGVWDVRGTVAGPVRGLAVAFAQQRFSRIIFDAKVEATWADWPDVLQYYRVVERIRGPRVYEGADTSPALVLEPIPPAEPSLDPATNRALDRELQ
jgi:hypothetical protein